jgi:hypothetical protein
MTAAAATTTVGSALPERIDNEAAFRLEARVIAVYGTFAQAGAVLGRPIHQI